MNGRRCWARHEWNWSLIGFGASPAACALRSKASEYNNNACMHVISTSQWCAWPTPASIGRCSLRTVNARAISSIVVKSMHRIGESGDSTLNSSISWNNITISVRHVRRMQPEPCMHRFPLQHRKRHHSWLWYVLLRFALLVYNLPSCSDQVASYTPSYEH